MNKNNQKILQLQNLAERFNELSISTVSIVKTLDDIESFGIYYAFVHGIHIQKFAAYPHVMESKGPQANWFRVVGQGYRFDGGLVQFIVLIEREGKQLYIRRYRERAFYFFPMCLFWDWVAGVFE